MKQKKLSAFMRCLRVQKGLSQENMAYDLDISITAYSKIERGLVNITLARLDQIANSLNVSLIKMVSYYTDDADNIDTVSDISTYESSTDYDKSAIHFFQTKVLDLEEETCCLKGRLKYLENIMQNLTENTVIEVNGRDKNCI